MSYTVNKSDNKAWLKEDAPEKPDWNSTLAYSESEGYAKASFDYLMKQYESNIASLRTIQIAPEYVDYWSEGDKVPDGDFTIGYCTDGIVTKTMNGYVGEYQVAIPAKPKQDEEEEDIYDAVRDYRESHPEVENQNSGTISIEKVLSILNENAIACKELTDEDKIRSAQDIINETYEDLIAIFSKYNQPKQDRKPTHLSDDEIEKMAVKHASKPEYKNAHRPAIAIGFKAGYKAALSNKGGARWNDNDLYQCALQFFYHWYNAPGKNTAQGLQAWLPKWIAERKPDESPMQLGEVEMKDKEFFDEMSKEDIWHKWQSDKRMLKMYMYAMAHYGVKNYSDVKAVAELEIENRKQS